MSQYTSRFKGQVAIVTGAARGIGKGIATRLRAEGARVVIFDVNSPHPYTEGPEMTFRQVDITKENEVRQAIDLVVTDNGRLDILVNAAGIIGSTAISLADYDTHIFDEVLGVNLKGAFLVTKYALVPMISQKYGRILHITSIGGKEGNPGMIGYAASKSGLIGLVKGAGKEYAETGITINGLAPAVIATEFNENTDPAVLKYMTDKIPMKRMGTVEEVASLACWIVSR